MKEYTITSNDADQRLDKFLKKLFSEANLSFLYSSNRKGKIKVIQQATLIQFSLNGRNEATGEKIKGKKKKIEYKLQLGDRVQIYLSDDEIKNISQKKPPVGVDCNRSLRDKKSLSKKDIVFEDADLLVINKSPQQNVHPGDHASTEVSLIECVQDYYSGKHDSLTFKPSLIHRIDRDTSGIIMIAKSKKALTQLSQDFKNHSTLKKTYFAIVIGKLSRKSGTITKKLKRIENAKNENKVQVSDKGLEAITHYRLVREYELNLPDGKEYISTLELEIETGRMHQIRVHLAHIGNPILGDRHYGNKKLNAYFSKNYSIQRQQLHAWKIQFQHPITHKLLKLEAPLKRDMIQFIQQLKK